MKVFVVQDCDGQVVGVTSCQQNAQTGRATGVKIQEFELDGMLKVGPEDLPWVVYFNEADKNKPQVWLVKSGFPEESGPLVFLEGIEYLIYAKNPVEALSKVYEKLDMCDWFFALSKWKELDKR